MIFDPIASDITSIQASDSQPTPSDDTCLANKSGPIEPDLASSTPTAPKTVSLADYRPEDDEVVGVGTTERPEVIPKEELDRLRTEAKKSLFFFSKGILGMKDLSPDIHGPICRMLEDGTKLAVKVVLPRTWFKSSLCSIAYPIWRAINNPNIRILIAQNTASNAVKKLREISEHFLKNQIFRSLFPELLPTKEQTWTVECLTLPRDLTAPEGTFEAAGVKTKLISRHYDEVIEDDTVAPDFDEYGEENIAPTKEDIGLAIGWHKLVPPFFVNPSLGRNIVVGTRWFEADLMSYIDQNEREYFSCYERAILETNGFADEHGTCPWPDRYDARTIKMLRQKMGLYMFSCLYLNKPVASANQLFKLEWFSYYETEERDLCITTTVDPGGDPEDTKGRPDYNVVCTTGKSLTSGICYVLEVSRGYWSPSQLIDEIFRHVNKYNPLKVGIEAVQYQKSLLHWVRERQKRDTTWFSCEPITNNRKSKNARIAGLQPLVESKNLLFRRSQGALVAELLGFPNFPNDDMADALAMHLPLWLLTRSKREIKDLNEPDPLSFDFIFDQVMLEKTRREEEANPIFDLLGGLPTELATMSR